MLRRPCTRFAVLAACVVESLSIAPALARDGQGGVEGELREMTKVGFQQFQDGSRVFVRTNDPAKYRIDSAKD